MSQTFTLKDRSSTLSANFYPPIILDPNYQYSLALIGFYTYNSIPNIEEGCNKIYYTNFRDNIPEELSITIPTGAYEIADIERYLQSQLGDSRATIAEHNEIFSLKPNNNTLKCEIKTVFQINFEKEDSIGQILGFSKRILEPNILYESDLPVNITKVITIGVKCNIVSGSYYNSNTSHILCEFPLTVNPGYSVSVEPRNLIYLPIVNRKTIDNITLNIVDQNSQLINFNNEEIVVRLELKKYAVNF